MLRTMLVAVAAATSIIVFNGNANALPAARFQAVSSENAPQESLVIEIRGGRGGFGGGHGSVGAKSFGSGSGGFSKGFSGGSVRSFSGAGNHAFAGKGGYSGKGSFGGGKGMHHRRPGHRRGGAYYAIPYGYVGPYGYYSYNYTDCDWLLAKARRTGSRYWWNRYYECVD